MLSIVCSTGIFATTIQAQDFKDTAGDQLIGRKTLPIVAPTLARATLMLALLVWTFALTNLWKLSVASTLAFHVLALLVGGRFVLLNGFKADQNSFYYYNVSVVLVCRPPRNY